MLAALLHRLPAQARGIVQTVLFGVAGGLVAVALQKSILFFQGGVWGRLAQLPPWQFLAGSLALIVAASLGTGWLLAKFCPEAAGSGIPQLKVAYWRDFGVIPARLLWVKFAANVLSVGGGLSLGREGPTVQMAGGAASVLSSSVGLAKTERRSAAAAGAAAGLSAAFNTPIAAVTFVLEEIVEDLNSRYIGKILLASVVGAAVLYFLVGKEPAFHIPAVTDFGWKLYLVGPPVAAGAALAGALFQNLTLRWRRAARAQRRIPGWLSPLVGGLTTWVLGCALFLGAGRLGVFGLGYDDLGDVLNGRMLWQVAAFLLAAKLLATAASFAWGGCGGIFAPCLFLGGMSGAVLAAAVGAVVPLSPDERMVLAVVGMSACLGAVVRAPVTSILIVFEMTHEFSLVPLLMLGALAAQAVSRLCCRNNIYAEILEMDGHVIERYRVARDFTGWFRQPAFLLMNAQPRLVSETALDPDGLRALLAGSSHARYPVVDGAGRPVGLLPRAEAERALAAGEPPRLRPVAVCPAASTLGEVQKKLAEAGEQIVVLADETGAVRGLMTLHDLLRAQFAAQEAETAE